MAAIDVVELHRSFGDFRAVRDVNLAIADGEFVFFLGPSGCGKTTTLRMIAGLLMPSSGRIAVGGRNVTFLRPRHRNVGMVFQQNVLYPHMSVYENLAYPLKARGQSRTAIRSRVADVARSLQIDDILKRMPAQLSGGQAQRVAIGRMLVREASVFLMDEPISHLDANLRAHMRAELRHLQKELGTTTMFVTHDQLEAMSMADRIVVMSDGEVQQFATPQEIFDRPTNLFVASFVGEPQMNLVDVRLQRADDGPVLVGDGFAFAVPAQWLMKAALREDASELVLGVRPEHISVAAAERPNAIVGSVYAVEPMGAENLLSVTVGDRVLQARVPAGVGNIPDIVAGAPVWLEPRSDYLYLFDRQSGATIAQAAFTFAHGSHGNGE